MLVNKQDSRCTYESRFSACKDDNDGNNNDKEDEYTDDDTDVNRGKAGLARVLCKIKNK